MMLIESAKGIVMKYLRTIFQASLIILINEQLYASEVRDNSAVIFAPSREESTIAGRDSTVISAPPIERNSLAIRTPNPRRTPSSRSRPSNRSPITRDTETVAENYVQHRYDMTTPPSRPASHCSAVEVSMLALSTVVLVGKSYKHLDNFIKNRSSKDFKSFIKSMTYLAATLSLVVNLSIENPPYFIKTVYNKLNEAVKKIHGYLYPSKQKK